MATTDANARVTDRRKLPIEEISGHAGKLYTALFAEDDAEITRLCEEWLDMSGYSRDKQAFEFSFKAEREYMDIHVDVTCHAYINEKSYSQTWSAGYANIPRDDTPGELAMAGASILLGIELAIMATVRKVVDDIIFPDKDIDFRKSDTLFMLTTREL